MRNARVWQRVLGLVHTVIEGMAFDDEADAIVVKVRPTRGRRRRCGRCGRRGSWYDRGEGRRRWRCLDLGTVRVLLEADAPRVKCPIHGPTVVAMPWARHGAGHTRAFDDTVAWLAVQCSKTAVTELMRIAWRTVGAIVTRVSADVDAVVDRLEGLRRIGIDEISYKRGHRYLTVVVDHDTGRLVWAAAGRDIVTLRRFFDALGPERSSLLTHVSSDGAEWIAMVLRERCPDAVNCGDAFHVVSWAMNALDEVRRQEWNAERGGANRSNSVQSDVRKSKPTLLKRALHSLRKNPDRLTPRQQQQLKFIAGTHPRVWRAYQLKEGLRMVFVLGGEDGKEALVDWLSWARRSRLPSFVRLAARISAYRKPIEAALEHDLSNARTEAVNTRIRLITRRAFGFQSPAALIALAMLSLGGYCPPLPGRSGPTDV